MYNNTPDGTKKEKRTDDNASELFQRACEYATEGRLPEAEHALLMALEQVKLFPKGWAILAAVLLAQGRETDAEKAGKKAIEQCSTLKMTWPRLRNAILSNGVRRVTEARGIKRVYLNLDSSSAWGEFLNSMPDISSLKSNELSTPEETQSAEKRDDHGPEIVVQHDREYSMKREPLPSIATRKIDGLAKLEKEKLETISDRNRRLERDELVIGKRTPSVAPSERKIEDIEKREIQKELEPTYSPRSREIAKDGSSWFRIGKAHQEKGNLQEAESAFKEALVLEPGNSAAWTEIGRLAMERNDYSKAEEAFIAATKYSETNIDAWFLLGTCIQETGRWRESIFALKKASSLDENRVDIWLKLGIAEFNIGHYQDASRSFLSALRISPNEKDAMFYLARCMERRGNRQHAFSLYIKLFNMGDLSSEMLEKLSGAFDRLNRPQEAREARRRATLARKIGV